MASPRRPHFPVLPVLVQPWQSCNQHPRVGRWPQAILAWNSKAILAWNLKAWMGARWLVWILLVAEGG
jgi:hypothetical protein